MIDKLPPKILVVAEDSIRCNNACVIISRYWFNLIRCTESEDLPKILSVNTPNIVIVNFIDRQESLKTANKIRQTENLGSVPIIFVINEGEEKSSYSIKPNDLTEVVCRPIMPNNLMITIKNMLRKSNPVFEDREIQYQDIKMDLATFQIFKNSQKLKVGPTEFKILELLMKSPNKIFSRLQIIIFVWGCSKNVDERTVDVHVNRLRKALKISKNSDENIIKTVRHAGYCLSLPETSI